MACEGDGQRVQRLAFEKHGRKCSTNVLKRRRQEQARPRSIVVADARFDQKSEKGVGICFRAAQAIEMVIGVASNR